MKINDWFNVWINDWLNVWINDWFYMGIMIHPPTVNFNDWFNVWILVAEEITIGFQTLWIRNKVLRPSVARHVVVAPVQVLILLSISLSLSLSLAMILTPSVLTATRPFVPY